MAAGHKYSNAAATEELSPVCDVPHATLLLTQCGHMLCLGSSYFATLYNTCTVWSRFYNSAASTLPSIPFQQYWKYFFLSNVSIFLTELVFLSRSLLFLLAFLLWVTLIVSGLPITPFYFCIISVYFSYMVLLNVSFIGVHILPRSANCILSMQHGLRNEVNWWSCCSIWFVFCMYLLNLLCYLLNPIRHSQANMGNPNCTW